METFPQSPGNSSFGFPKQDVRLVNRSQSLIKTMTCARGRAPGPASLGKVKYSSVGVGGEKLSECEREYYRREKKGRKREEGRWEREERMEKEEGREEEEEQEEEKGGGGEESVCLT